MSGFQSWFSKGKKHLLKFFLERYLGKYLEKKFNLDQITCELANLYGELEDITIDAQAVNEDFFEKNNFPVEIVDGSIRKLCLQITFENREISLHIIAEGLNLAVQPKTRTENATSLIESVYNSMSSSTQLAEDFAKSEYNPDDGPVSYEGQQVFVKLFDSAPNILEAACDSWFGSIIRRTTIEFRNTIIYLEQVPRNSNVGVGININIDLIHYSDVSGTDQMKDGAEGYSQEYLAQAFSTKRLILENVKFSTSEFSVNTNSSYSGMTESYMHSESVSDSRHEIFYPLDDKTEVPQEESPDETESYRHNIIFGKLNGTQEILIRLRQPEILEGPKVSVDVAFSALNIFLSPRQLFIISELVSGFINADTDDTSNAPLRNKYKERPMTSSDYDRVEQVLQQEIQPPYGSSRIFAQHGWSSAGIDEEEETFLPMNNARSDIYESTLSSMCGSMESSINSTMTGSASNASTAFNTKVSHMDPELSGEVSHFQIRLASLAAILLHEDIMSLSVDKLIPSSVEQMKAASAFFFSTVKDYALSVHRNRDFDNSRGLFEEACQQYNHLRILATPIQVEMRTLSNLSLSARLTGGRMEILECLYRDKSEGPQYVPLLTFTESALTDTQPALKIDLKHVKHPRRRRGFRRSGPRTNISFWFNKCSLELDVTMVDRITTFNPQMICPVDKIPNLGNITSSVESSFEFKVSSPVLNASLRFPVPDHRPAHDMNKVPWWKRNVRPDYLLLSLFDFKLLTEMQSNNLCKEYLVVSRALEVFYYETESSPAVQISKTNIATKQGSREELNSDIRIQIRVMPDKKTELSDLGATDRLKPEIDPMIHSVYGAFENQTDKQPGPFSAKKVVHTSDTPHPDENDDSDQIILPGEKEEIDEFIKSTSDSAKIYIDICIPTVSVQLSSKHIFELLYNRINNDLLLWQPSAPKVRSNKFDKLNISALGNLNIESKETFSMCKSGARYMGSDTESEEEEEESEVDVVPIQNNQQSDVVINLQIGKGMVDLYTLVRDTAGQVIPEHNGQLILNASNTNLFIVSGYKGDDDLVYVCLQVSDAQLYHCEMMNSPSHKPFLMEFGAAPASHMKYTIHKSESGVLVDCKDHGCNREMLTVAVKVQAAHETHFVKIARVAVGLNKATLKHRMCNEPNSWISQIMDFFDAKDYPITGYTAKEVLTEFHLHMWDCAIDYRPLYLPLRSVITLGSFSMSSQLAALANTSTLRFIFEKCDLYISEKGPPQNGLPSKMPVYLKRDYVNVIEVGIFELSIRTNDKKCGINPHFDLRASNDFLYIRTCADSGRALMQLITYYASDGDLLPADSFSSSGSNYSSPRHQSENDLICFDQEDNISLSETQQQHLEDLLGDAMEETVCVQAGGPSSTDTNLSTLARKSVNPRGRSSITRTQQKRMEDLLADAMEDIVEAGGPSSTDNNLSTLAHKSVNPRGPSSITRTQQKHTAGGPSSTDSNLSTLARKSVNPQGRSSLTRIQQKHIEDLIADAMEDIVEGGPSSTDSNLSTLACKSVNPRGRSSITRTQQKHTAGGPPSTDSNLSTLTHKSVDLGDRITRTQQKRIEDLLADAMEDIVEAGGPSSTDSNLSTTLARKSVNPRDCSSITRTQQKHTAGGPSSTDSNLSTLAHKSVNLRDRITRTQQKRIEDLLADAMEDIVEAGGPSSTDSNPSTLACKSVNPRGRSSITRTQKEHIAGGPSSTDSNLSTLAHKSVNLRDRSSRTRTQQKHTAGGPSTTDTNLSTLVHKSVNLRDRITRTQQKRIEDLLADAMEDIVEAGGPSSTDSNLSTTLARKSVNPRDCSSITRTQQKHTAGGPSSTDSNLSTLAHKSVNLRDRITRTQQKRIEDLLADAMEDIVEAGGPSSTDSNPSTLACKSVNPRGRSSITRNQKKHTAGGPSSTDSNLSALAHKSVNLRDRITRTQQKRIEDLLADAMEDIVEAGGPSSTDSNLSTLARKSVNPRDCSSIARTQQKWIADLYADPMEDIVRGGWPFSTDSYRSALAHKSVNLQDRSSITRTQQKHIEHLLADAMEDIVQAGGPSSTDSYRSVLARKSVNLQDRSSITRTQQKRIEHLLADAMEDIVEEGDAKSPENGAKMFFFPDEKQAPQETSKPVPQVTFELGDVTRQRSNSKSSADAGSSAPRSLKRPKSGGVRIHWKTKEPLKLAGNSHKRPSERVDLLDTPKQYPTPVMRYTLCELSAIWYMFGGNDFTTFGEVKKKKTVNFENASISFHKDKPGTVTFDSASPQKHEHKWKDKGGANRDHSVLMQLQLNKVRFRHELFPETEFYASRQVLLINQVEILDRLKVSNINKFLYLFYNKDTPKQTNAYMVHVRMAHIRPDKNLKSQECGIKISLQPLRLNIDQDSLLFLIDFFSSLTGSSAAKEETSTSKHSTPTHQPPVMSCSFDEDDDAKKKEMAKKMLDENLMLLMESRVDEPEIIECEQSGASTTENSPVYFRNVIFSPDVPIRIDYQAKRLDMTHGPITGILMGLAQLNCSEIRLVPLQDRRGILGFDKLVAFLLQEWLNHIKKHQLHRILGGIGPLHSFMQLFQGIRDLFWLPIEQYQRDGRIVRGLQRGANSFTTSTAAAALELTSRLIYLIQLTAETAYDMLSPGPSVRLLHKQKGRKKKYSHPQDIREGLTTAATLVREGIEDTASGIVERASRQHEQKGYSGAFGGIIREVPGVMLKPVIVVSAATGNIVSGIRSQLIPDARTETNQKWRVEDT